MLKNTAGQVVHALLLLRADGTNGTGLTPTVRISKDGGAFAPAAGAVAEQENGSYLYPLSQAETNCDHLAIMFTEATAISVLINLYPIDVALYKANVDNLDVPVSSRMPTTHIDATGGKVNSVALVDNCTNNGDMRGTDGASTHTAAQAGTDAASKVLATPANLLATDASGNVTTDDASRTASQADVSGIETTLADVPKRNDGDSYRQLRNGAGAIVQEIRETITSTQQS